MIDDIVEYWLKTGKNALIGNTSLKPVEHHIMEGKPLSVQKGQSIVYYLLADNGEWWLLKKFLNNQSLDKNYLSKIKGLLPPKKALSAEPNERFWLMEHWITHQVFITAGNWIVGWMEQFLCQELQAVTGQVSRMI